MRPDYGKRDCLLPKGCKDLIDVLKLEKQKAQDAGWEPHQLPPVAGELVVWEKTSAGSMGLGVFLNVSQPLAIKTVSKIWIASDVLGIRNAPPKPS